MRLVRTASYLKDIKRIRLTEDEALAIELAIFADPLAGDVI